MLDLRSISLMVAAIVLAMAVPAVAQPSVAGRSELSSGNMTPSDAGSVLDGVGFDQNLGAQVPLDLHLRDEQGRDVRLGDYFGERPVVLAMVYYRCPLLCSQVLNGLVRSLRPLKLGVGKDFDIVTVSIDPADTPQLASLKKQAYLEEYGREGSSDGWHFLTGEEANVRKLAHTVGFRYTYNPTTKLYAHAAGIVILTPGGRVSRYLYGIDYAPRDVQFALIDSSAGKISSPIRRVLLLCYNYDAATGAYTLSIVRVTQILGVGTVLTLAAAVALMLRWERRRRHGTAAVLESANSDFARAT